MRHLTGPIALLVIGVCGVGCGSRHAPTATASQSATVVAPAFAPATLPSQTDPALSGRAVAGAFDAAPVKARTIDDGVRDGLAFLVRAQNADGSWGTGTVTHGNEVTANTPASHQAFRAAVTALGTMALRESLEAGFDPAGVRDAHARGVEWLATKSESRREQGDLLYTFWANAYVTQALAGEIKAGNADPRVRQMAAWHIDRLARYATFKGGWNYYDFVAQTQEPSMGPTAFGSAAGLLALWEARQAGLDVPQQLVDRTVHRLEEMHLPTGAYLYGSDYARIPRVLPAHMVPGSLGRTQAANLALLEWNSPKISRERALRELPPFFTDHAAMEMGRKKPYPHESWYQVSGYYYYFGQYYAARLIQYLGDEDVKKQWVGRLSGEHILDHQEADGSWWDYAMWDYHKPYGTSFAVMALLRCR